MRSSLLGLAAIATLALPAGADAQNRALGQPAFQSSLWAALRTADRVVDGSTQGSYGVPPYVNHTDNGPLEWWYVDLGATYDISQIRVFNRTDCCEERLNGARLGVWETVPFTGATTVGTIPTADWSTTFSGVGATPNPTQQFDFSPPAGTTGRYVGVWHTGQYIHLAEVEVFGVAPSAVVPEPSTVALMAGGLLALGALARRRRTA